MIYGVFFMKNSYLHYNRTYATTLIIEALSEKWQIFALYIAVLRKSCTVIFDKPYFLVVEAKQDKSNGGWGQCLAELVAIQKINNDLEQIIFGIVSNGQVWQFSKLKGDVFTKNIMVVL